MYPCTENNKTPHPTQPSQDVCVGRRVRLEHPEEVAASYGGICSSAIFVTWHPGFMYAKLEPWVPHAVVVTLAYDDSNSTVYTKGGRKV